MREFRRDTRYAGDWKRARRWYFPDGCAAALATIDCLFEDKLIENAISLGQRGLQRLTEIKAKHPIVQEVRGLGLFFGMELRLDDQPAFRAAEDILYHSLSDGLSYKK